MNVRNEVLSGAKWNAFGQFTHYGVQFIVSMILARILIPEEFGLIGMLSVFLGISTVFIQSGLSVALIQKKNADSVDFSTVFYYNIVVSLVFYLILFACSDFIANFYHEPKLVSLMRYTAIVFVINAAGVVQSTILRKELKFKKLNIVSVVGVFSSAVVAIIMALNEYGVYSLVAQSITYALVTNVLYWLVSDWKPQFIFSIESFKQLFGFGSKLLGSSILDRIYTTIDTLIIGKVFSASQLGFYSRAKATRDIPVENTTGILTSIVFPIFSKLDNDSDLKKYHLKFLGILAFIIFPVMGGLAIVAEPLTILLFSETWLPSVKILQLLCLAGPAAPFSVILVQTILAKGNAGLFLKLDIYKKIIGVLGMGIGLYFGFYAFIIGVLAASVINLLINFIYTGKLVNTKLIEYLKVMFNPFIFSFVMCLSIYAIGMILPDNVYIMLFVQVSLGIVVYVFLSSIFKVKDFIYLKEIIKERFFKKNKTIN